MNLNVVVVCKPIQDYDNPLLNRIEKTYNDSFPEGERRDFSLIRDLIRDDPRFFMYALLRDEEYVGFITGWIFSDFTYLEHFAIDASARNGGIGGAAMKQFLAFCETPVVLEVEMPTDEMSKRRIGFYERLGFVLDSHLYYQPPYREGEPWLEMRYMTYGPLDLNTSFEEIKKMIYKYVYNV